MEPKPQSANKLGWAEAKRLIREGVPIARVAKRAGISRQTIYSRLKNEAGEPQTHPADIDTSETNRSVPSTLYTESPQTSETDHAS